MLRSWPKYNKNNVHLRLPKSISPHLLDITHLNTVFGSFWSIEKQIIQYFYDNMSYGGYIQGKYCRGPLEEKFRNLWHNLLWLTWHVNMAMYEMLVMTVFILLPWLKIYNNCESPVHFTSVLFGEYHIPIVKSTAEEVWWILYFLILMISSFIWSSWLSLIQTVVCPNLVY